MDKRDFLAASLAAAVTPRLAHAAAPEKLPQSPVLLTVSGMIGRPNRGALDPVRDQMMAKQKIAFEKARVFDFPALMALPAVTIKPTLEYDSKVHTLRGPLLMDMLKLAGVADTGKLALRAVDGYSPTISMSDVRRFHFIVATHLDGQTMPLGGLGPLWLIYDADRFPDIAAKPVDQRFASCPWSLYHIDVQV